MPEAKSICQAHYSNHDFSQWPMSLLSLRKKTMNNFKNSTTDPIAQNALGVFSTA
jgi:hypothetical protein